MVDVRSRSDRRSEKKQSFVFIAFMVTVAIVCFASGFMVGRNTAPKSMAELAPPAESRQPIAPKPATSGGEVEKKEPEKLTFYEALPKGEQPPLGSGINLPPKPEEPEPALVKQVALPPEPVKKAIPEKVFEPAAPAPAPKPAPAPPREDEAKTAYILQVASFPEPDEAGKLLGRLTQGGYDVYVQQADLGSKGVWYRVFVGPVVGKSRADSLMAKIEKEFRVKPILRKK